MKLLKFGIHLLLISCFCLHVQAQASDTLRVGIIQYKSAELVMETYEPMMDYVAKQIGKVAKVEIVPERDLSFKLQAGDFDLGIFTIFPYLSTHMDFDNLEVFASHLIGGKDYYTGLILVNRDAEINSLKDLSNKYFAFVKPTSTSGYMVPKGIFREQNIEFDHSSFFDYSFSQSHAESVRLLRNRQVDGIAIDEKGLSALPGGELGNFDTLETYVIPYHAYVLNPSKSFEEKSEMMQVMFDAHKSPEGREIFINPLNITRWVPKNDDYYNDIRRYLRIVRVQPALRLQIEPNEGAARSLMAEGDVIPLLRDRIKSGIRKTRRFSLGDEEQQLNETSLVVKIYQIAGNYDCHVELDGEAILEEKMSLEQLRNRLPDLVAMKLLVSKPIETELITNGEDWFVAYGTNDGLNLEDYEIEIGEGEEMRTLSGKDILRMDTYNTYLASFRKFKKGDLAKIKYLPRKVTSDFKIGGQEGDSFWDNYDNRWGVIGLLVALVTVMLTTYFANIKKKRFRNMLNESNQLLLGYIEGKYKLDHKVLEQKDKSSKLLQKGHINENQFLILQKRLDEIHNIVQSLLLNTDRVPENIRFEVQEIIKDGIITETEYTRLMAIMRNYRLN